MAHPADPSHEHAPDSVPAPVEWFYALAGQHAGPVSQSELENLIHGGAITRETLVWMVDMPDWQPAANTPGLAPFFADISMLPQGSTFSPVPDRFAPPTVAGPVVRINQNGDGVTPAGLLPRFFALMIDSFILGVVYFLYAAVSIPVFMSVSQNAGPLFFIFWTGLLFVLFFLYFALQDCSSARGTLGKRALGLAVVDLQGNQISLKRSMVRAVVKVVLSSSFFMIGCIIAVFTPRKQSLHDLLAQTIVVPRGH